MSFDLQPSCIQAVKLASDIVDYHMHRRRAVIDKEYIELVEGPQKLRVCVA